MGHSTAHDVVVVGGGAAGLAGALCLVRARRSVLVVDAGEPRNAPAGAVHNFLTRDGTPPSEIYAAGRAEVASYGGEIMRGRVVAARPWEDEGTGFVVTITDTSDQREVRARRLLVASGVVDLLPEIIGLRERWGRDVVHCPYCHGYEVRDRKVLVLGRNGLAGHAGLLWRQWSADVTVLVDGAAVPVPQGMQAEQLHARGVAVEVGGAAEVIVRDDAVTGVRLDDGRVMAADVVVCAVEVSARTDVLDQLGVATAEVEFGGVRFGTRVVVEATGATSVPGVYAAGNVTDPAAQVVTAAAAGAWAGAQVNMSLIMADADAAVSAARADVFERPGWEKRYDGDGRKWSGRVNAVLATHAGRLPAGRALDVGSGEGGDALWLAARGWQVTGLEFSANGRARATAAAADSGLSDRVEWRDVDVRRFDPGDERWDLVTSHFVHLPDGGMVDVTRRLAAAVAPGGTLLVVGHHPQDLPPGPAQHAHTAEEVAVALDPAEWDVTTETRPRRAPAADGTGEATWHDAVLVARRNGG